MNIVAPSPTETVIYAGYGTNCDPQMIESLLGRPVPVLAEVVLTDVELVIQRLDQVTREPIATAPLPLSPHDILSDAWGENSGFRTYGTRPKRGASVGASLFEIYPVEKEIISDFELVAFGWYREMFVRAKKKNGSITLARTEGFRADTEIEEVVDGLNYQPYLNDRDMTHQVAQKVGRDFYDRQEAS